MKLLQNMLEKMSLGEEIFLFSHCEERALALGHCEEWIFSFGHCEEARGRRSNLGSSAILKKYK